MHASPMEVINRMLKAGNEHDLSGLIACMSEDYKSEQPVHPDRAFQGRDQVRKNWSAIFEQVPDIRMELLNAAVQGSRYGPSGNGPALVEMIRSSIFEG